MLLRLVRRYCGREVTKTLDHLAGLARPARPADRLTLLRLSVRLMTSLVIFDGA